MEDGLFHLRNSAGHKNSHIGFLRIKGDYSIYLHYKMLILGIGTLIDSNKPRIAVYRV